MKRREFIELWVREVGKGRKRNFPDIRPSEAAVAAVDDAAFGARMWRRHRVRFATMNQEQVLEALGLVVTIKPGETTTQ